MIIDKSKLQSATVRFLLETDERIGREELLECAREYEERRQKLEAELQDCYAVLQDLRFAMKCPPH